eukprot:scaffold134379_cov33-Attheya_sp.AAC.2
MSLRKLYRSEKRPTTCVLVLSGVDTSCLVEDGANYLKNIKEVAVNVLTVLDGIRHRIQRELQMNLNLQNLHETMTPHVVDVGDEFVERHIDFDSMLTAVLYNTAVGMLSTTTKTGYALIRRRFIEDSKFDGKDLPSFHMLTKNRPKKSPMLIVPVNLHSNELIGAGPVIEFESLLEEAAELQNILDRRGEDTINEDVESLMAAKN